MSASAARQPTRLRSRWCRLWFEISHPASAKPSIWPHVHEVGKSGLLIRPDVTYRVPGSRCSLNMGRPLRKRLAKPLSHVNATRGIRSPLPPEVAATAPSADPGRRMVPATRAPAPSARNLLRVTDWRRRPEWLASGGALLIRIGLSLVPGRLPAARSGRGRRSFRNNEEKPGESPELHGRIRAD